MSKESEASAISCVSASVSDIADAAAKVVDAEPPWRESGHDGSDSVSPEDRPFEHLRQLLRFLERAGLETGRV